jgi:hypothetical protein
MEAAGKVGGLLGVAAQLSDRVSGGIRPPTEPGKRPVSFAEVLVKSLRPQPRKRTSTVPDRPLTAEQEHENLRQRIEDAPPIGMRPDGSIEYLCSF